MKFIKLLGWCDLSSGGEHPIKINVDIKGIHSKGCDSNKKAIQEIIDCDGLVSVVNLFKGVD